MARVLMAMKIDPELKEELKRLAEKDHRTLSNLVEITLRKMVEENRHEPQKA